MGDLRGWDATDREEQIALYHAEIEPMRRLSSDGGEGSAATLERADHGLSVFANN